MNRSNNGLASSDPERARISTRLVVSPYLLELAAPADDGRLVTDCISGLDIQLTRAESLLLTRLGWAPFSLSELEQSERQTVEQLCEKGLILDAVEAFERHQIRQLDIEINSHCNFRCVFCPVADDHLPVKHMSSDVYTAVVDRAVEYGVPLFALNHYGEPTLDPKLPERVELAAARGIHVVLYSNGSRLKPETSRALAASGNTQVVINLPSADPDEYRRATQWRRYDPVIRNIRSAVEAGLTVSVAVNMPMALTPEERAASIKRIATLTGVRVFESRVISRAGTVENDDYVAPLHHAGRLGGCRNFVEKVSVNIGGKLFLCCNDYYQKVILGDLLESSLSQILEDPRTVQIRRWVFGANDAPGNFICRSCEYSHPRDAAWGVGGCIRNTCATIHLLRWPTRLTLLLRAPASSSSVAPIGSMNADVL